MTSVLGIDASKAVGSAYFASSTAMPKCATWHGSDSWLSDSYGRFFVEFEDWLIDAIRVLKPDVVVFESPLLIQRPDRGTDEQQVRRLVGIAAIIEKVRP